MHEIHVVGSCNMDLVMHVESLPATGHTVLGGTFQQVSGGKGANQAVAAKRAGGNVVLHAAVGMDEYGDALLRQYNNDGIDCANVIRDAHHQTGTAVILVDVRGENLIAVASGANQHVKAPQNLTNAGVMLLQGEIQIQAIYDSLLLAGESDIPVILNNAPVVTIPEMYRSAIDFLIVNEHEAGMMTETVISDRQTAFAAASRLHSDGYRRVIVTLGADGVICSSGDERLYHPAYDVNPVDTTAAGDTFCGAFATRYVYGDTLTAALAYASAAAARSTQRLGAQSSIPTSLEIDQFLAANPTMRNGSLHVEPILAW